jgi:hypothetical protein
MLLGQPEAQEVVIDLWVFDFGYLRLVFMICRGDQLFMDHLESSVNREQTRQFQSCAPFTTVAVVYDCRTLVCTALLDLGIPHSPLPALGTFRIRIDSLRLHLMPLDGLDD